MKCPKCGSECKEGAKVCTSCGKELKSEKPSNKKTDKIEILDDFPSSKEKEKKAQVEELEVFNETISSSENPEIYESEFIENTSMNIPNPLIEMQKQLEEERKQKKKKRKKEKTTKNKSLKPKQEKGKPSNSKSKKSKKVKKKNNTDTKAELEKKVASLFEKNKLANNVITLIAIVAVIFLTIFVVKILITSLKDETKYINDIYSADKLIPVKENKNYGYIDTKGKLIIPIQYTKAGTFSEGYAVVEKEISKDSTKEKIYQVINKNGKVKIESEKPITYIKSKRIWIINDAMYNSSLKKISADGIKVDYESEDYFTWISNKKNTGGIINNKGKITYKYSFKGKENNISVEVPKTDDTIKEKYCRINISNNKYAIVNCDTGTLIQNYTKDYISVEGNNIFKLQDSSNSKVKKLLYIANNKIVYETKNENISIDYYPGYLQIRDASKPYNERYNYMNLKTLKISKEKPSTVNQSTADLSEWEKLRDVKTINCGANYGLSHGKKVILPCEWQNINPLDITLYKYLRNKGKDYVYVQKDNQWHIINLKNKKIIENFDTSSITTANSSPFLYYTDNTSSKKNKHIYNILTGKSIAVNYDMSINLYSNYVTVKDYNENKTKFYNDKLEHIYTQKD